MYHQPSRACCPTTLPEAELNIHVGTAGLHLGAGWAAESLAQGHLKVPQAHRAMTAMTVPLPEAELNSHATTQWLWVVPGFGLKSIEAPISFKP